MLRRLHIRDFVIIERLALEFESGFGALTGETGAGKSILVDALSLVLGERADASVVRQGAERAEISAEFDLAETAPAVGWLRDHDFDTDACLVRRVIEAGGRSRAYVNGAPATATQLRELGEHLVDIHGQHAHHALLRTDTQRMLLDAHAGLEDLARRTGERFRAWQEARQARLAAEENAASNARERELLEWQVRELEALGFDLQQWQETVLEHRRLGHAASLLNGAEEALAVLDEGDMALAAQVESLAVRFAALAEYDARLTDVRELLEGAQIQIGETVHALRRYREHLDLDPQRLAELERRIAAVDAIARKHHVTAEALPDLLDRLQTRLGQVQSWGDPAVLAERERQAHEIYLEVATQLSAQRTQAAGQLSRAVSEAMQQLSMPDGRFEVALERVEEGAAYGLERVECLVTANSGQPLRPLARVASGGELSRIGLGIQVITSKSGATPTLVFDEVDVGIGGRVAEIVGRLLKELGCHRQVLCVTHLPQVAAQADWQWSVAKDGAEGGVVSRVTVLDRNGRIEEIARMLGGVNITDTTRKHAREMLGY